MPCLYPNVLNRPCGRAAVLTIRWEERNGHDMDTHEMPVCTFHHDLQLADLLLSCDVGVIERLTLAGEQISATPVAYSTTAARGRLVTAFKAYRQGCVAGEDCAACQSEAERLADVAMAALTREAV